MAGERRSGWRVSVKGDTDLQREFTQRAPDRMQKLSVEVLNRAVARSKTGFVRLATQQYTWKAGYVRERTDTYQANVAQATPRAQLVVPIRATLLSRFAFKQASEIQVTSAGGKRRRRVRVGVMVQVRRDHMPTVLRGAFMVRGLRGSDATGIAQRAELSKGKRVARLPIEVFHSVSVHNVLRYNAPALTAEAEEFIGTEIQRRIIVITLGK